MHSLIVPSFFFTNKTGAPQGETLGRIYPFSSNSSNCFFNSCNLAGAILYGALEMGVDPGINSMLKSNSLCWGIPGISSGNTFGYSQATGMSVMEDPGVFRSIILHR